MFHLIFTPINTEHMMKIIGMNTDNIIEIVLPPSGSGLIVVIGTGSILQSQIEHICRVKQYFQNRHFHILIKLTSHPS